jgi:chromatin segregation and condensation protein Rec8/ScpA/Scc1 (kleisin family)
VEEKMRELLAKLEERGSLPLLELLGQMRYRAEAVTAFLATLELVRLGVVTVYQPAAFAEIHVSRTEAPFSVDQIRDEYR